ncbi:hypothetical protein [Arthrobacter sp. 2MCAF14]|uniref:hypothetical protein n=1 Tax=Arthrobacter sp. 2MCAF14 TaxID=3232982 RepID=UPI003F908E5C
MQLVNAGASHVKGSVPTMNLPASMPAAPFEAERIRDVQVFDRLDDRHLTELMARADGDNAISDSFVIALPGM